MYWYVQHLRNLMRLEGYSDAIINVAAGKAFMLMMASRAVTRRAERMGGAAAPVSAG